jgi:hypothetical protein
MLMFEDVGLLLRCLEYLLAKRCKRKAAGRSLGAGLRP